MRAEFRYQLYVGEKETEALFCCGAIGLASAVIHKKGYTRHILIPFLIFLLFLLHRSFPSLFLFRESHEYFSFF